MCEVNLKPCPFCGAKAFLWRWNGGTRIDCSNWNAVTGHFVGIQGKTDEEAIALWQRRFPNESDDRK